LLKYSADQPLETMALRLREQHQARLKEFSVHEIDHLQLATSLNKLPAAEQDIIISHMSNIIDYDGGDASEHEYMYKTLVDLGHVPPNTDIRKCVELDIGFENLATKSKLTMLQRLKRAAAAAKKKAKELAAAAKAKAAAAKAKAKELVKKAKESKAGKAAAAAAKAVKESKAGKAAAAAGSAIKAELSK